MGVAVGVRVQVLVGVAVADGVGVGVRVGVGVGVGVNPTHWAVAPSQNAAYTTAPPGKHNPPPVGGPHKPCP